MREEDREVNTLDLIPFNVTMGCKQAYNVMVNALTWKIVTSTSTHLYISSNTVILQGEINSSRQHTAGHYIVDIPILCLHDIHYLSVDAYLF